MADDPVKKALADSHKLMDRMNNSNLPRQSVFAPKPEGQKASPTKTDYSHARAARGTGEFAGIRNDQAPEINNALKAREDAKKALEQ